MVALVRLLSIAQCWNHSDWEHFRKNRIVALQAVSNNGYRITTSVSGRTISAAAILNV